ncbi:MAG: ABC transporter ATP-binding protein [Cyanobacteria bacterium P01_D01_bin.105]
MQLITVHQVSKQFPYYDRNRPRTIMAAALSGWRRINPTDYFWALQHVSFTVDSGEMVGIIGKNGAGKSTLLKLLGQVGVPDEGHIAVGARVGALLDLGAGFHDHLTGRENVVVNGVVAGLLSREVLQRLDEIVEFAEIERFVDNPVRTYSTGMKMRLAFSLAVHTQPDILLVDEHLAVGDRDFQDKCLNRIAQMKEQGCAIVLVSHNTDQIAELCDRAIWLERGKVRAVGTASKIVEQYLNETHAADVLSPSIP